MEIIKESKTYKLYGFDTRDGDGYVRHYREMRKDDTIIAAISWKAGRNGFKTVHYGDKYAQYKARCEFGKLWCD